MFELATNAMILFSFIYGMATINGKIDDSASTANIYIEDSTIIDGVALSAETKRGTDIETEVRDYFKDTPILAEIAKCESSFRHIDVDGEVIKGEVNQNDIGVMQINTYYHDDQAEKLGIDLNTFKGNMQYAKVLYEKYGTQPWKSSSPCWQKYVKIAKK